MEEFQLEFLHRQSMIRFVFCPGLLIFEKRLKVTTREQSLNPFSPFACGVPNKAKKSSNGPADWL